MKLFKRAKHSDDEWSVSLGTLDDAPIIIRINNSCSALVGTHPIQIAITLPLNEPRPGALPSPDEDERLGTVQDKLVARLGDRGVLSAVITTGEMQEFVVYARSADWIEQFHHKLEAAVPDYNVDVIAKTDADWSIYRSLAEG
jgi:hypothetical protein